MPDARLEVTDALGRRIVPIAKEAFGIGRRETNDLRLAGSEVSRDHAEIVAGQAGFLIRDKQSRYGTYVNDEPVGEQRPLVPGDRIRLGRSGGPKILADLLDGDLANVHMGAVALGIRNVQCVPLKLVRYVDKQADAVSEERRIGVLYLDSREKGSFLSSSTRGALETLATEA